MADLFEILGIDEDYDARMSAWLHELLASSETCGDFLRVVVDKLNTMSQLDAFISGMFF